MFTFSWPKNTLVQDHLKTYCIVYQKCWFIIEYRRVYQIYRIGLWIGRNNFDSFGAPYGRAQVLAAYIVIAAFSFG